MSGILRDIVEKSNTSYSSLLSSLDIYLLPLLNPDGYEYSRTTDRLWRKVRPRKWYSLNYSQTILDVKSVIL